MPETYEIKFNGHRLTAVLDHATAADIVQANGQVLMIPAGCNTVKLPFRALNGNAVLAYAQRGFAPLASDNEMQINGTGAVILEDSADMDDDIAFAILEEWMKEVTGDEV